MVRIANEGDTVHLMANLCFQIGKTMGEVTVTEEIRSGPPVPDAHRGRGRDQENGASNIANHPGPATSDVVTSEVA